MRRGRFIGGLLAAAMLVVTVPAGAQSYNTPPPRVTAPPPAPPRVAPIAPRPPPVRLAIRPSQAAMIAQRAFMGAKVLGVKPRGNKYAVTLKLKNQVKQVTVNGINGNIE